MKILARLVLSLVVAVSAVACAQNPSSSNGTAETSAAPTSRAEAEPEIYEAVFRYQFDHNASAIQKRAERYCLSLPIDRSPDASFLQRFEGNKPPVVSLEECQGRGGKNLTFRIQKLDWRSDNEVWVRGGYYEGNLSSSVESYRVLRQNGKWVVKGARMEMIS